MSYSLQDYDIQRIMDTAKHQADPNAMVKALELWEKHKAIQAAENQMQFPMPPPYREPEKFSWEQDEYRNKKSVTINVQIMVENLLGGRDPNKDVQVRLEKYGDKFYSGGSGEDNLAFVVVNICDIKTGNIITLRETYAKFPSPEFLTKLELLRVGKTE